MKGHCASVMSGDEPSALTIAIALTEALVEGKLTVTIGVPANQKLQQTKVIGKKAANNQPRLKKKRKSNCGINKAKKVLYCIYHKLKERD